MPKAIVIEDEQLQHAVKVTKVSSPEDGNHDAALLLTCFGTGMTVTEICRLRMSDYLTESCTVLIDFEVRVEIAYNHRSRPLCWTSKKLTNADSLTQMKIGVLLCTKLSMNDGSPTQDVNAQPSNWAATVAGRSFSSPINRRVVMIMGVRQKFAEGDVFDHKLFGLGKVKAVDECGYITARSNTGGRISGDGYLG